LNVLKATATTRVKHTDWTASDFPTGQILAIVYKSNFLHTDRRRGYNSFMWRGASILFALSIALLIPRSLVASPASTAPADPKAAVVIFQGEVDDFARDSLEKRFAEARAAGAKTIILKINTYGGLVTAGLDISGFIKRQTDLHTIAFIDEKAISAGAMISMSCDEIVMDPSSVIGDCAPIIFKTDGTIDSMGATERAKAESPVLADFLDSAARNGHDPMLAEAMVAINHPIFAWKAADGSVHFTHDQPTTMPSGWTPLPDVANPLNSAETLLTVHTRVADEIGLSHGTAESPQALAQERGLQIVGTFSPGAGEEFVEMLSNAAVRLLLITIFIASLQIGLSAPGHGAAEAVAVISLGLLVGLPLLTGYAQWWEVLMIFAGIGLVAFEIFVFPGHFISAAVGIVMFVTGLVLTFAGSEPAGPGWLPQTQQTWTLIQHGILTVTGGMAGALALGVWLNRFLPHMPYFNRLILTATSGGATERSNAPPASESAWPPIGSAGRATTDLRPGGSATFADGVLGDTRIVAVISDSGYVSAGATLIVREVHGNRIVVRPVVESAAVR
jgi:membrane-bound serine protease (ClpP class)